MRDSMEVTFISSGAISRAHYALVRKVEAADSTQLADQHLLAEVQSIRHKLSDPGLSTKRCKTYLAELLYCSTAMTTSASNGLFDFALSHAVKLAEAGHSVPEKRIGYLFCAELMPPGHELHLMLINTIRKDLESSSLSHICLALESLISSSTEDIIPAVQSRLHDLLYHNSAHVRRRALLAFRALSQHNSEILTSIKGEIKKRLRDRHLDVAKAALALLTACARGTTDARNEAKSLANELVISTWSRPLTVSRRSFLLKSLQTVRDVGASTDCVNVLLEILSVASEHRDQALLLGGFMPLSELPLDLLAPSAPSLAQHIRPLLVSKEPNDQYLLISCLACLHPSLWAGTTPGIPAAFEGAEVERMMLLLNSADRAIRRKTLRTIHRVEPEIVATYYRQSLQAIPSSLSDKAKNEHVTRLLEVVDFLAGEDGETYAQQVQSLLAAFEAAHAGSVLESAVDLVLSRIREANDNFRVACAGNLLTSANEPSVGLGPTSLVLISALACEFSDQLPTSPVDLLQGLAARLPACPANVQDALLLSMLRIAANCDSVPPATVDAVTELQQRSSRHIRRRCDQFLKISGRKDALSGIITKASSSSLPDFLRSLEIFESSKSLVKSEDQSISGTSSQSRVSTSPPIQLSTSKLRYAAYEAPQPIGRLRRPAVPPSQRSFSSSSLSSRSSMARSDSSDGHLNRTVTAGQLTIAAVDDRLDVWAENGNTQAADDSRRMEDLASRVDLIAFDSPFVSEPFQEPPPRESRPEALSDFQRSWDALQKSDARGWSASSIDAVVEQMQKQGLHLAVLQKDSLPFEGEVKVSVSAAATDKPFAFLRLKEDEDASCLWRMRSADDGQRATIRTLLMDT